MQSAHRGDGNTQMLPKIAAAQNVTAGAPLGARYPHSRGQEVHSSSKNTMRKNGGAAGPAQPLAVAAQASFTYTPSFGVEDPLGKRLLLLVPPENCLVW